VVLTQKGNKTDPVLHGRNVLGIWLGKNEVHNLSQPVQLRFRNSSEVRCSVSHHNATLKIQLGHVVSYKQLPVFTSVKVQLHYCRMKVDSVCTGISMKMAEVSMIFTPSRAKN